MQFIEYSKCSTCKKAKDYLESHHIVFEDRSIIHEAPTVDELENWIGKYHLEIKKMFNTSGMKYRDLQLKDKLERMSDEEKINLLASDGMLIKRPILIDDEDLVIGFKKDEYQKIIDKKKK